MLTVLSALGAGFLVTLGLWQLQRLEWKETLIAKIDARLNMPPIPIEIAIARAAAGEDMEYTPVRLQGTVLNDLEAHVFGAREGQAGVFVFVPIRTQEGPIIYVNEGFLPQGAAKTSAAAVEQAPGEYEAVGLLRNSEKLKPPTSWFRHQDQRTDGLWYVRAPDRFAAAAGFEASPYYVDRFAVEGRDWPQGGTTRLDFRNKHLEYALTWFGLAGALAAIWLIFSLPAAPVAKYD